MARSASRSASVTGSNPAASLLETAPCDRNRGSVSAAAAAAMRRKNSAVTFIPHPAPLMQECHAYGANASIYSLSFKNWRLKLDICAAHNQFISGQFVLPMPSLGVSSLDFDRV